MPGSRETGAPSAAPPGAAPTVCLAASPGGHMAELQAAAGAFPGWRRAWVTGASRQADALRDAGEDVRLLPAWGRDPPGMRGFLPNVRAAGRVVRALRPRLVVTTGAGLVVPFALLARATGGGLVLVESMARVTDASLTGRLLAPVARMVVVQWPEMRTVLPGARVCRPALLDAAVSPAGASGEGTFVSVGTRPEPFDRLLAMVDRSVSDGVLPRPVTAQSGFSRYRPRSYEPTPWMAPHDLEEAMGHARYVVCHGGAAMVASALAAGRRPLVLPRMRSRGEHRTEHQGQLVTRLASLGAVVALADEIAEQDLRAADEPWSEAPLGAGWPSVEEVLREEAGAVAGAWRPGPKGRLTEGRSRDGHRRAGVREP